MSWDYLVLICSRAPANGGMSGGARSNGVSAGAQAQIEDLTTQVLLNHLALETCICHNLLDFFAHFGWLSSPLIFSGKPH